MKVLLVDDEPSLLFAIRDFLTTEGFYVECASGRAGAETLLLHTTFDVAITDLSLTPRSTLEGLELAASIRERAMPTRVIVLTAIASPEAEAEARRIGVEAYLRKPASLRCLANAIRGNAAKQQTTSTKSIDGAQAPAITKDLRRTEVNKKKVLLVDDSNTVLMMERMILAKGPFEIVLARDGMEAVAKAKSDLPDVILLDVMMPKLDGLSACAAIRAEEATSHIPIIMVTTRGEEQSIETAFRNGCTDYVTKPINGLELLTKLQNILGAEVLV